MFRILALVLLGFSLATQANEIAEPDFLARVRCQQNLSGDEHAASEQLRTDLQLALRVQQEILASARIAASRAFLRSLTESNWRPKMSANLVAALKVKAWPANAKEIIAADPYIMSLESQGHRAAQTLQRDADPKSPRFLSPELSLIRIARDFDSNLTPEQKVLAYDIFRLLAQENFITSHLWAQFAKREPVFNGSWNLAVDLTDAQRNYRRLLDLQQRRYGHYFPETKFEDLRALVQDTTTKMDVMRISDSPMFRGLDTNALTYPFFLVRSFGDDYREYTMQTMRGLRLILEVSDAVQDQVAFGEYLEEMLRQHAPPAPAKTRANEYQSIDGL